MQIECHSALSPDQAAEWQAFLVGVHARALCLKDPVADQPVEMVEVLSRRMGQQAFPRVGHIRGKRLSGRG